MQVGTTKDQGLYNKPSAAVHPGALAAGTLPQYNIRATLRHQLKYIREKLVKNGCLQVFCLRLSNFLIFTHHSGMSTQGYH